MLDPRIPHDDINDERPADLGSRPCVPTDGSFGAMILRHRGVPPVTPEGRWLTDVIILALRTRLAECGVRAAESVA